MLILMMMVICLASAQPEDLGEPTDGQVLRERGGGADEDEEAPLGEDVEGRDGRVDGGGGQGFDVDHGEVDIEEEEENAETADGGLSFVLASAGKGGEGGSSDVRRGFLHRGRSD